MGFVFVLNPLWCTVTQLPPANSEFSSRCLFITASCLVLLGSALLTVGIGGPMYIGVQLSAGLRAQLVVSSNESAQFALWADNRAPDSPVLQFEWRFFNVVNADAFEAGRDTVLRVDEVGPYVYRELLVRSHDLRFVDGGDKAEYTYWNYWTYDQNATGTGLDALGDRLTLPNLPLLAIYKKLLPDGTPDVDQWWRMLLFDLLAAATNASLFVRDVAPDASAYGYVDPTLLYLHSLAPDLVPVVSIALQINDTSPEAAAARNQSMGTYTGQSDVSLAGTTYMFNGHYGHLDNWASSAANEITGCDAFQCAPDIHTGDSRVFWLPPLYRPLSLTTNETYEFDGVQVNKFYVDADAFMNASSVPSNAGFYQNGPSGVANLTSVPGLQGAPVFISNPHFYLADERYTANIELVGCADGRMCPDPPLHSSWIGLEPLSGLLFGGSKVLQVSVQAPDSVLFYWPNITVPLMPIAWVREVGVITSALAQKFNSQVSVALLAITLSRWIGCIVGGLLFVVAAVVISIGCSRRGRSRGYSRLIVNN